jgi:site-specific DNA-methyltransferase (adenine-specific)/site-specific DNA-methyltransferase (cytosine-N4-specific)
MVNPLKDSRRACLILCGDSREQLKTFQGSVDLVVTSPPYADSRKKHYDSMHPEHFAEWFSTFHDVLWNSLKGDGSLVINIKDKVVDGVRHRYVWETISRLTALGWNCIEDYMWHKPNPMPGYWPTRLRDGWEYCFHLAKSKKPYMNQDAVRIPIGDWAKTRLEKLGEGDKKRHNSGNDSGFGRDLSRWVGKDTVLPTNVLDFSPVTRNKGHPAAFPPDLPQFFIKLLSRPGGLILDPFGGSGTTAIAALSLQRDCVLVDNSEEYCRVAYRRVLKEAKAKHYEVCFDDNMGHYSEKKLPSQSAQLSLKLQQVHASYVVNRIAPITTKKTRGKVL